MTKNEFHQEPSDTDMEDFDSTVKCAVVYSGNEVNCTAREITRHHSSLHQVVQNQNQRSDVEIPQEAENREKRRSFLNPEKNDRDKPIKFVVIIGVRRMRRQTDNAKV